MKIAVTDACIFIDILELELCPDFFRLEMEIHTTCEVWEELIDDQKETLELFRSTNRLTVHFLEVEDLDIISSMLSFSKTKR